MGKIVEVRGVRIGEGRPKIIVPIVGCSLQEVLEEAGQITGRVFNSPSASPDLVEWRADWYRNTDRRITGRASDSPDSPDYVSAARELRNALGDIPLLFTFRTAAEGGQKEIPPDEYADLCIRMAESGLIDLLDVELSAGEPLFRTITEAAHACGVYAVASSHDFEKTPPAEEIISRLRRMQALDADICKIAVMPQDPGDVLTLLDATWKMKKYYADRPLITISMSGQGLISRLCGETFGSDATFGTIGKASAPGQIDAASLRTALDIIHSANLRENPLENFPGNLAENLKAPQ